VRDEDACGLVEPFALIQEALANESEAIAAWDHG
jgi:hypothetical protein